MSCTVCIAPYGPAWFCKDQDGVSAMSVDAYDTAYVCPQISHYIALDHTLSYCIILYHTISYDLSIFMISYTIKRYPNIFLNISKVVHYISKYLIISHNISKHVPFSRSLSRARSSRIERHRLYKDAQIQSWSTYIF